MSILSFKDLVVWEKSYLLAVDVYAVCEKLPKREAFGLSSQIQRCAVSIPSNIAEGQQRNGTNEFRQFIGVAKGSAAELETQLMLVRDIYKIDTTPELATLSEVQRMLHALKAKLS